MILLVTEDHAFSDLLTDLRLLNFFQCKQTYAEWRNRACFVTYTFGSVMICNKCVKKQ